MARLFFFTVGLACIVLAVLLLVRGGETLPAIGVLIIGISTTLRNGIEISTKD